MKQIILYIAGLFLTLPVCAQYEVTGGTGKPWEEKNTYYRIQVYLLNGLSDAEISYTSDSEGAHQWYKYNTKTSEAVAIPCLQTGKKSTITGISDGFGYFVGLNQPSDFPDDPSATSYIWIIDYSRYLPSLISLNVEETEDKCAILKLIARVEAAPLTYHVYSGATVSLPREYHLKYNTLEWNEDLLMFDTKEIDEPQTGAITTMLIDAPLQNTTFKLTGDRYAAHFGLEKNVESSVYEAIKVEAHAVMEIISSGDNAGEQNAGGSELQAPVDIKFTAYANDPVAAMYIWQIVKIDPDTKDSTAVGKYTEYTANKPITHTFRESGTYVAQLDVSNSRFNCSDNSQSFPIFIGDSNLILPNAFSPGSSIGSNDEYRVSYKSLISFKASIYNRWGNLLYHWEDPAKGWDGKVNGKYVPTGVYFIVVEAKGADGKSYTKSKDINVLRTKNF
jgi:gliding motility-associated-like protein